MTIENNLASIAKSLEIIASVLSTPKSVSVEQVTKAEIVAAPIASQPLPNVQPAPIPVAPVMVTAVVTQVAVPVTPVQASPFSAVFANQAELTAFVMDSYKALGPIKGAKIQDVLTSVGVKNINEVKPEMYAAVKTGVEALKV